MSQYVFHGEEINKLVGSHSFIWDKGFLQIGIAVIPLYKYIWEIDLGYQEAGDEQLPNCS